SYSRLSQGGQFVEIFSAQGKVPGAKWKLCGSPSAIWKDFDKEVKSFVYVLEGSSQTNKMQLPKDSKQTLGLIQRYLVLQIFVPLGQDFSAELLLTDLGNIKRRLYLSTVHKELSATPLHAKIPLSFVKRKIWCNLGIDLVSFTSEIFKGAVFQSLDGIVVSANCKLRKIFTMKLQPQETAEEDGLWTISIKRITDAVNRVSFIVLALVRIPVILLGFETMPCSYRDQKMHHLGQVRGVSYQIYSKASARSLIFGYPCCTERSQHLDISDISFKLLKNRGNILKTNRAAQKKHIVHTKFNSTIRSVSDHSSLFLNLALPETTPSHHLFPPHPHPPRETSEDRNSNKRRLCIRSASKERSGLNDGKNLINNNNDHKSEQILSSVSQPDTQQLHESTPPPKKVNMHLSDEWQFPDNLVDSFHSDSILQTSDYLQPSSTDFNHLSDYEDEECDPQIKLQEVFTYSSRPRSAPHGKSQNKSAEGITAPLDSDEKEERQGARMEDDFHRSDSSEELHHKVLRTSSPRVSPNALLQPRSSSQMITVQTDFGSSGGLNENGPTEAIASRTQGSPLKKAEVDKVETSFIPTPSLSPTGSRPQFSVEIPDIRKRPQDVEIRQLGTSLNRKSLREIQRDGTRMAAEKSEYDWKNYQPTRMSASELHMLASLQRQQMEELEDDEHSHGLSASQIDNCNVSISTSSDDTTTWTSCLPPPVNQGHHYQKEMNPLSHSNPR
uniref:CFAP20 domain containing n=1 Tax=Latimeria chalumnae TaxID=7897 RepID=H3ADK5_LATCH